MNNKATIISRRRFLKLLAAAPALAALGPVVLAEAQSQRYGKLVDTIRCIGCKRCMSSCKRWNNLKVERDELVTDRNTDLSGNNFVVVNLRTSSRNREEGTYHHWTCQHCQQPACVGACPVSAITKLSGGHVVINESKCIGCRYCYQSCPWKVPQFDFKKRVASKCTLCYDKIPTNYLKPACVTACPVEALIFDYKLEVIKEANRRMERLKIPGYLMGFREAGGTDVLTILPARPQDMGFVVAPEKVINQDLDKRRITSAGLVSASTLVGILYLYSFLTRGKDKRNHDTQD
jgi:formate dehydrogenase iron-sulfur subunit